VIVRDIKFFVQVFENFSVIISELDVLQSFADLATSCPVPYVRPDITTSVRTIT
jgi:DNA mismatch repair protein MSH2